MSTLDSTDPDMGAIEEHIRVAFTLLAPIKQDFACVGISSMPRLSRQAIDDLVEAAREQLHMAGQELDLWDAASDVCFADPRRGAQP